MCCYLFIPYTTTQVAINVIISSCINKGFYWLIGWTHNIIILSLLSRIYIWDAHSYVTEQQSCSRNRPLQVSFRLLFLVLLMHIFYVNFLLVSVVMDQLIDGYFWFLFLQLWALFFFFRKLISSHLIKIRRHCFIWLVAKLSTHQVVKETAAVQEQGNETSAFALQSKKHSWEQLKVIKPCRNMLRHIAF